MLPQNTKTCDLEGGYRCGKLKLTLGKIAPKVSMYMSLLSVVHWTRRLCSSASFGRDAPAGCARPRTWEWTACSVLACISQSFKNKFLLFFTCFTSCTVRREPLKELRREGIAAMAASCRPRGRALALALALALVPLLALAAAQDADQETFDPDVDLNTTADGYLLTLHRIPGPRLANASAPDGAAPPDGTGATPTATSAAAATARPSGADAAPTTDRPVAAGSSPPWTTEASSPEGTWTTPSAATATSDPTSTPLPPAPTAATPPNPPATTARFVPVHSTSTSAPQTTSARPPPSTTTEAPTSSSTAFASASQSPTSITTTSSPTIPTNATSTSTPPPITTITSPTTTAFTNSTITTAIPSTAPIIASNITTTTAPPPPTATTAPIPSTTTSAHTTTAPTTNATTPTTTTTVPPPPPTTTTAPPPVSRPVIFLQHGLLGSSYDWIVAGPDKGLAYLLADAGYDVWMGNARGNTYSRAHVYLPTEPSSPFWDFSFHEMGIYDLPAVIDYVLNTTGASQLHYVGHSMGTTMFFVMASAKPEAAAGVASMHALAPVVYFLAGLLGDGEFLPQNKILHYLAKYGCELLETERDVCENLIFILCGYDKPQFNTSILPVLLSHTPAGASTRTLIHYAQMIKSGKFQQYDLGKYGNLKKYRSLEPPTYDLSKVNVSVHLVYANNDWLAAPVDVNTLYQELHCTKTKYVVPLSSFNHLDFILAKDVKTLLYDKLLKEIPRDIDYQNYEDNFLYD
ncbi:Lipase 3 [Gryllus bimaculatus]|nr:Lipase 3 [Gryllus bimaculatus]